MSTVTRPVIRHEYQWQDEQVPVLAGFIVSSFSPLAAAVADACLSEYYAQPAVSAASRQRTGVLLASRSSDLVSAEHVSQTVAAGRRLGPLFFFQSAPNSVVGQITAHWGLGGPVVCISPIGDPLAEAMAEAALMLEDGDADEVLLILIEQGAGGPGEGRQSGDRAHALLLAKGET
jgi:3-oxoacyl-(acyl-carrier-protein) synthase